MRTWASIVPFSRGPNQAAISGRLSILRALGLPSNRPKLVVYLFAALCSSLLFGHVAFGFPQSSKPGDAQETASSIAGTVSVSTGRGEANALSGVTVKLSAPDKGPEFQSAVADKDGRFQFAKLSADTYTLEISVDGFKPWSKTIAVAPGQAALQDASLEIQTVSEQIEVQGQSFDVSTSSAETKDTISDRQLETLPLAQQKFTEALPLSAGVIRTPEGKLNFNGQAENQGILLLNSTEAVDPVTGTFAIPVPVDVIQSMSVHSFPDTAEFGGFSGGMTVVEIRPPLDTWNFRLHDLTPSFRGKNDHLVGVGEFTPRLTFGGPIVKSKLNFTEELTYEVNNLSVRGLSWPVNETKTRSVNSFTQAQYILSSRHLVDANLIVFPLRREFADINAFVPQTASSDYGQNGFSLGLSDSFQLNSGGFFHTEFRYTWFHSHAHGQGAEDMLVTPEGWSGNFFNSWSRDGDELEFRPAFEFPSKSWHGQHQLKIGVDVSRRSFDGSTVSHPIQLLRQDGSLAEEITFQGQGLQATSSTETGEFVEDRWNVNTHLTIDAGARLSFQSIGRGEALGPHVGIAYSPRKDGRTVIRAGIGTVYGHVPLLAADFLDNPTRMISYFDPSGAMIGQPIALSNVYLQTSGNGAQIVGRMPGTSPRTLTWRVDLEREIRRNVALKLGYLDSQTRELFIVNPVIGTTSAGSMLGLANTGAARYHRFEATVHARLREHEELNVSYVWSRARGDLNALADIYVPFEQPVIRPNVSGILPANVPNRVITTGLFDLPFKLTLSPVVDVHTGLPYSNVDVLQNYVGPPNSLRFPICFSLDTRIYREFPLHLPFREKSTKRKIRFGVYSINLTGRRNPEDVFSSTASPLFGQFAGFERRIDGLVIDLVD
jgi:Carboxypeptidase regulatory-like domain/TonB dependent receptor